MNLDRWQNVDCQTIDSTYFFPYFLLQWQALIWRIYNFSPNAIKCSTAEAATLIFSTLQVSVRRGMCYERPKNALVEGFSAFIGLGILFYYSPTRHKSLICDECQTQSAKHPWEGLIKTIPTIPHKIHASYNSLPIYRKLRLSDRERV